MQLKLLVILKVNYGQIKEHCTVKPAIHFMITVNAVNTCYESALYLPIIILPWGSHSDSSFNLTRWLVISIHMHILRGIDTGSFALCCIASYNYISGRLVLDPAEQLGGPKRECPVL